MSRPRSNLQTHFTFQEREVLYRLNKAKRPKAEIAKILDRDRSGISRSNPIVRCRTRRSTTGYALKHRTYTSTCVEAIADRSRIQYVLRICWKSVRRKFRKVRRLVIYLDKSFRNSDPKNSGRRTQFLKRKIEFADWSGLALFFVIRHLVYYLPYHSKYNPIERRWSSLQKKWNGVLLTCWEIVHVYALRMTWRGVHPSVDRIEGEYPTGITVLQKEMKELNKRLERSTDLPKHDILIRPQRPRGR